MGIYNLRDDLGRTVDVIRSIRHDARPDDYSREELTNFLKDLNEIRADVGGLINELTEARYEKLEDAFRDLSERVGE